MSKLGDLWFGVGLQDNIKDSDIEKIRKRVTKGLEASIKPTVDVKDIVKQIRTGLAAETFQIKLGYDEAALKRKLKATVDSIGGTKFSASDLRAVRASTLLAQSEEKLNGMRQQTRQRLANAETAELRLAAARKRNEEGIRRIIPEQEKLNRVINVNSNSVNKLSSLLAKVGGFVAIEELGRSIVKTTGDFQFMESAIVSLVGSEQKGVDLMKQLKDFARISPLEVRDVTKAAQTLLGFNVELSKVPDMIQRIGDVSMGNKDRFNALSLAFAQTTSAARLTGEDLRQYVNAGFNPLQVIAEKTGKSMRELKEEMMKGAISVEMVEQAFIDATSAGGKFYNMSEKQSQTINGQLAKLSDTIDRTFNEIGSANEEIITGAISTASKLIENYEQVGRILVGLLTTYGAYRTGVMLATVAENGHSLAMMLVRLRILATQKAQALLNTTMLANPYVLAATALGVLAGALIASSDGMTAAERAQKNFNDAIADGTEKQKEYNSQTEQAIATANNDAEATDARREALNLLIDRYGDIMKKYIDEKGHLKDILQLKKEIAIIDGNKNVENLTNKAKRYSDAAEAAKLLVNGKPLTQEQQKLIAEMKEEYFGENGMWAKAWYNDNDLVQWANKMAGNYGKKARREAAVNAATRFQDVVSDMTDAQLQTLQKVLKDAKSKKNNVVIKAYKELANVTLTQDDIDKLATYTGGIIDSRQAKARTKKVIEDERKAAQAQLDALTVAEANGKKGAELRKKIQKYTNELQAYDAKSSAKTGVSVGESAEKIAGLQMEQAAKLRRAAIDIEFSTRQAELNAQEESTSKAVALIELDHDKRLEAIKREFEDLRSERIKEAKALWDADASKKGVNFYESEAYRKAASESLTDEQQKNFDARVHEANKLYVDELKKVMDAETQAMYDYLSQYGSIQQMKLAITKDYDKRIAKAQNEWQRKQLEKERDAAIEQITSENLLRQADLSNVFSQYGIVLAAPLEEALAQLKKYTETASFKTRSFQDQQGIYGTIANLESQLNGIGGVTFSEIGRNLYEYNNALVNYTTASEELAVAAQESIDAKEALNAAEELLAKATTDEARLAAQRARDEAQGRVNAAGTAYGTAQAKFDNAQNALAMAQSNASESLQRFQRSIENVGKVASALASGSMRQLWDAFGQKTQKRIVEFVSGTRSYNKAVELAAASLSKQGKGMDFFVEKIQGLAAEIYNSGEKIEQSGVGEKISALFDKLFGDQSNKMGALGNDLSKIITKVLNDSQEAGEDADNAIKKAGDAAIQAITKSSGSIWGLIVGLIFDLLDVLAEGIGGLVETILEKVGAAIEGILTNIGSGKFFEQLAHGVANLVGGVIKGIGNLFSGGAAFGGSNVEDMEEEIARLSQANEQLAKSIDSLAKSISDKDNTNQQSEEAYKRALAAEKEWQENQRKAIDDRASEWSNSGHGFWGLGGKHSFNAYVNDRGADWYGWRDFTRVMKENGYDKIIQSAGDIWNLSPEMMKLLRDYAPQAWAELLNTDGEANPEELIDDYIARAGAIDELTSALNEKLTGYTWDGFKSSYVDMLKNLDSTNQDFADNMEEMLTSAILNSLVNEAYKDRIQALYKMIADAASDESEGGSQFTQNELAAIRLANETLSDDLLQARQNLIDAGVLKQTGSGSSSLGSSIKGISEQTGDLLASYVNAGRADLSVLRATLTPSIEALVKGQEQSFTIANAQLQTQNQMLHQLEIISGHTAAIGEIRQFQQNIYDILHRVTPDGTAVKIK